MIHKVYLVIINDTQGIFGDILMIHKVYLEIINDTQGTLGDLLLIHNVYFRDMIHKIYLVIY